MAGSTIAIIIIVVALLVILFTSYVKSPPDKAYIISGLRKTPKILIGKAGLKLPSRHWISSVLTLMQLRRLRSVRMKKVCSLQ